MNNIHDEPRKRGRPKGKGGVNMDIKNNLNVKGESISRIISESVHLRKNPPVKTNAEVDKRLEEYLELCQEHGQIPTVEDMCLALGVTRMTLHNWERGIGCDKERTHMIQMAKETLAAIDAKLVSEGKIPQVTYIFRSKNYFGKTEALNYANENDGYLEFISERNLKGGRPINCVNLKLA